MANQFNWKWNEKQHQKWATVRKKGRWHFILYRGVLIWGGLMFLLMCASPVFFGFPHSAASTPWYRTWNVILWAVAGFAFGFATWTCSEKMYTRAEGNES